MEDLEWAAKWIEGSLTGETDDRVIEFGKNMAMTLRAELDGLAEDRVEAEKLARAIYDACLLKAH